MEIDSQGYVEIQENFPDTHYILYKNKQYPIKSDFFRISSNYFKKYEHIFEENKIIKLVEDENHIDFDFTEEIILSFIDYVQHKRTPINPDNAIGLNYLSNRFEVKSLLDITNKYIFKHQKEFPIDIIIMNQNDENIKLESYEEQISCNLSYYIKNDKLIKVNLPILHRIFQNYMNQPNHIINSTFFNFLFKCLKKCGKKASILFTNIDFSISNFKYFNLLITEHSEQFDFNYINPSIFKSFYLYLQKNEEQNIENEKLINKLNQKLLTLQNDNKKLKCSLNKAIENAEELENNDIKKQKLINDLHNEIKKSQEVISRKQNKIENIFNDNKMLRQRINEQEKNISDLKINDTKKQKLIDDLRNEIKKSQEVISEKQNKIENIFNDNKMLRQRINEQEKNISDLKINDTKKQELIKREKMINMNISRENKTLLNKVNEKETLINESRAKYDSFFYHVNLTYKQGCEDGIINYLTRKIRSFLTEREIINVSSSSLANSNIFDNFTSIYSSIRFLKESSKQWICFDFKNAEIQVSSYLIKSSIYPPDRGHIKSWVIEISNDAKSWNIIDEHTNSKELNGGNIIKSFAVSKNNFSRYIRFRLTDKFWGFDKGYELAISSIEFFGGLKINKNIISRYFFEGFAGRFKS